jgi:hypothetical protein
MRVLRILGALVAALFAIYLILCAIGPKHVDIVVKRDLSASPVDVRSAVTDYASWESWSPWSQDSTAVYEYDGIAHKTGHKMSWVGDETGEGAQWIQVFDCDTVVMSLDFNMGEIYQSRWVFEDNGSGTSVTWTYDGGELGFMMRGMMKVMGVVPMMTEMYNEGLDGLEIFSSENPAGMPDPCVVAADLGL